MKRWLIGGGIGLILVAVVVMGFALGDKLTLLGISQSTTCPPLISPVDLHRVTAILYPGQYRGEQYKSHGGFRMDTTTDNFVDVLAPFDATMTDAARYLEQGEVQYLVDFRTSCGLTYRFDHLRTLTPKLQAMADMLPEPQNEQSETHPVRPAVSVTAGEIIATAVGFAKGDHGPNVSFDFGLYDRHHKNQASTDPAWAKQHGADGQASYGVCWIDWLPADDAAVARSLPGGDRFSGKTSDFCH